MTDESVRNFGWRISRYRAPMRLTLFVAALIQCAYLFAADDRPVGTNCELAAPPEDAGEELSRGFTVRIYPRARQIGREYTGCQVMFAPKGSQWTTVVVVEIAGGDPVRLWDPQNSMPEMTSCRYRNGKLAIGDPAKCPMPQYLIMRSFPPGCVEKIRKAVGEQGLKAPRPAGCDPQ